MTKHLKDYWLFIIFVIFTAAGFILDLNTAQGIFDNFYSFFLTMIKFVPAVFLLIGLFEVWVDKETIEKHLGEESGFLAYLWAIILASTTVGGLYVAFPVAAALYKKGASPRIIFSYIGTAAICRIPMTLFEASYVGVSFTAIRWAISIPLVIISSILMEKILAAKDLEKISENT
ncbi:permease [Halanaerobium saccharolyticum]|uniref:permease n=1 Tax=Halanaerobium saccharolyticum TaxID=43595 RepID=UPI003FCDCA94